ncbi:DNA replication regulator SLD3-domain-containing protein [Hypoxylon trugodes]|uniref:DNA replication regulator SLD3-domain-containing protein n=1 Tax=Hypoxylon trugodes TaxID=326681 RepID=UPI002192C90C|nr:DNA replication regulator SLD3-domain-containing protein [Hypoxylon trugodes]KAI1383106.1 DNA replication regulator SLD3-domain-containing protein [Hypoxylon trugodes]
MPLPVPGSDASRLPSAGILMPSPNTRPNLSHDNAAAFDSSPGQKRKRNAEIEAMEELLKPSIVIKPHPRNLSVKPRSLQPLMVLPREQLRLSFLDLSFPHGSFESSQFFESSIKILDLEGRIGNRPVVLIVRLETDKTIYAVERQTGGLYTLCQLGSWVDLKELQELATVSLPELLEKRTHTSKESSASLPLTTTHLNHETKKRRLAIEAIQSMVKKPRSGSVSTASQIISPAGLPTPIQENVDDTQFPQDAPPAKIPETQSKSQAATVAEPDDLLAAPTAESIFDNIRNQYLESLYHSMGSLAYFAKGPLSRARAAFHMDCDSNLDMSDLIEFLKSLVMTTAQIGRKYRETIPEIISKMKSAFQDSEVEGNAKTKKRKARKMKLGKNGLYPMEDDRVRKWWDIRKPPPVDDEVMTTTEPQETKLHIAWLRSRETQLQVIIILEILALESLVAPQNEKESQLPGLPISEEASTETPKAEATKKRSKHNLSSLIDVHADRLCIWQSTSLDEVDLSRSTRGGANTETQKSSRATSDPLKEFCVDIIVPFFSARLPEKCDSINRKLGGPIMMPPPKPKQKKPEKPESAVKSKSKSSSTTKRPASVKSSGTLESVLSKESEKHRRSMSRGPSGVIALMRSASTPMLKRENSEPLSMMSIPQADSATSKKMPRPPVSASAKRKAEEEKARKEALVKAELKDAISVLRRPNRDVVGKDIAEAAERRTTTSLSQLRKSKKPTQHTRPQDVIKATPVGNRFRDVLGMSTGSQPSRSRGINAVEGGHTPSSSLVPSSTMKRNHDSAFSLEKSPSIPRSRASTSQVDATPARPSHLKHSFMSAPPEPDDEAILASSPIMSRKASIMSFRDSGIEMPPSPHDQLTETPMKPRAAPAPPQRRVAATPTRRRTLESGTKDIAPAALSEKATVNAKEPARKASIYEKLGWDDDFDELS